VATPLADHLAGLRQALEGSLPDAPLITALKAVPPDAGAVLRALGGDLDGAAADVWGVLSALLGSAIGRDWRLIVPTVPDIAPGGPIPQIPLLDPASVLKLSVAGAGRWDAPAGAGSVSVQALELEVDLGNERIALRAAGLRLDAQDPSGILGTLGMGSIGIAGDLGAIVDASGFRFTGGSQHDVELAPSFSLPIGHPRFGLGWDPNHATLALTLSFTGSALGMTVVVEKVGVGFSFASGMPTLKPKAPDAIGLAMDHASGVSGGGFLGVRADGFGGVLNLHVGPVEVTAFGLLTPDPFSLIIVMAGEFDPGIQLSFGLMLSGVGGVIGINHRLDTSALADLVQQGSVDQLLFPKDPVASAPAILTTLDRVFPRDPGTAVFGPLFRLSWGPVIPLITADLGVVLDVPAFRFAILGRLRIALPYPDLAIVDLRASLAGMIDPGKGLFEIDVSLTGSRISGFSVSGGLVARVQTSGGGELIFSAGGFHPRYKPPADLPVPQRLEIKLADLPVLQLSFRGYFAITSGSVQAGARLDLVAGTDDLGLTGTIGFDVLLQWSPAFGFSAELHASLAFRFAGATVASVTLDVTLEGPSPRWHIAGSASIKILFARVHFGVNESWGEQSGQALPAPDVLGAVRRSLEGPGAWSPLMPVGSAGILRLRVPGAGDTAPPPLAHPLGSLEVRQELAPLNIAITRFGAAPLATPTTLSLSVVPGAQLSAAVKQDRFAAGEFFSRSEDQQLTMPAFEDFDCGVTVRSAGITHALNVRSVSLVYEDKTIGGAVPTDPLGRFTLFEESWTHLAVAVGAVGRSDVHAQRSRYVATNGLPIALLDADRPVAMDTRTGAAVALAGVDGARSHAEAAFALATAVAADSSLAGTVALASAWEVAA